MANRKPIPPQLVGEDRVTGKKYAHPAYGQLTCSRISGGNGRLVGSEIQHQHFMCLRINAAHKYDTRYAEDTFMNKGAPIVEVYLSEHQWASFIASVNMGAGVPCTINRGPVDGAEIEDKPLLAEESRHRRAKKEMQDRGVALTQNLTAIAEEMKAQAAAPGSISKTWFKDCAARIAGQVQSIVSNMPFFVEMHTEMMERNVQAAKADVEGYIAGRVAQLGLESIRDAAPALPAPEEPQHNRCTVTNDMFKEE